MQSLQKLAVPILVLALAAVALVVFPSITSSQNQRSQGPRGTQSKFRKKLNAIPNRYIVVLDDDVADDKSPREARLERVAEIANNHALANLGRVDHLYETALKGYSIELPNEADIRLF